MNYDILDDDGSFGATVLVPGDVSTTSVALTTTFAESVTPAPPPRTSADDCPNDGSALSTLLDFSSPLGVESPVFEKSPDTPLCELQCERVQCAVLWCGGLELSIEIMYNYWIMQFSAYVSTLAQDVTFSWTRALASWHYLDDHHTDSGFYPS
ncbi:hypothetical protein CPB85DRAFT_1432102 [Mucidula mucida]|nr:hypothetical protein CPB85DRAFT_1432102 [Mucidula mucida]